jgi:hypothetical protein
MLGHLVIAHDDEVRAVPRHSLLRWLNRVVGTLLHRRGH